MNTVTTIAGMLLTRDGAFRQSYLHQPSAQRIGLSLAYELPPTEVRDRFGYFDALQTRSVQKAFIGVNVDHGPPDSTIGHAEALELRRDGSLWTILTVAGELPDGELYLSPQVRTDGDGNDLRIDGIAVTANPAQISMQPVTTFPGGLDRHRDWQVPAYLRDMVTRAATRRRRYDEDIVVFDQDVARGERREELYLRMHAMAGGPLHRGAGGRVLSVR